MVHLAFCGAAARVRRCRNGRRDGAANERDGEQAVAPREASTALRFEQAGANFSSNIETFLRISDEMACRIAVNEHTHALKLASAPSLVPLRRLL